MKENPIPQINQWVATQSRPFVEADLPRPEFLVLEVGRALGISTQAIIKSLDNNRDYSALANPKRVDKRFNEILRRRRLKKRRPWDPARLNGRKRVDLRQQKEALRRLMGQERARVRLVAKAPVPEKNGRPAKEPDLAKDKFMRVLSTASIYPLRNPNLIEARISSGQRLRIGCFVCLSLTAINKEGLPAYVINVDANSRIQIPNVRSKLRGILQNLRKTNILLQVDLLIADTDLQEIYGEWLDPSFPLEESLQSFYARQERFVRKIDQEVNIRRWSEVQSPYQAQYAVDFTRVYQSPESFSLVEKVQRSIERRIEYFRQKGIVITPAIKDICSITAVKNLALYAAQGPILQQEYDCLIIIDPDSKRLGENQTLLAPNLAICFLSP